MSNRAALVAVFTAFAVGLLVSLAVRPAPKATGVERSQGISSIRWRLPVAFATNLPALGDNSVYVSEQIEALSGGRFRVEIFEPGELVPAFSIVDAVEEKKVPAGYTWLGYDQGKLPASVLFGAVPFGLEPWSFTSWWYEGGGSELADEIYSAQGLHILLCGLIGPETAGWFREPIRSPQDFEGLKIRFAGLGGKAVQRLGASVTLLPGGEIFQALERGALDATEFSLPVVDSQLGFNRVASYNYFPGWHQPFTAFHMVIGLDEWNGLGDSEKAILETACTAGVTRNLARAEALQGPVLAKYESQGITTEVLSPEILDALAEASDAVLASEAQADPDFARVLASQKAFQRDYNRWKNIAYPAVR
ncbi:MAG: TRAP transporter substrate-binding protein [Myxococcota bacterium]|jgi:TRAP-type mannitol/chloroaromatic compound transport system substrate-binding protein|nr:TRAP transporter substrate-binding protein [Myxococcota bacterium]